MVGHIDSGVGRARSVPLGGGVTVGDPPAGKPVEFDLYPLGSNRPIRLKGLRAEASPEVAPAEPMTRAQGDRLIEQNDAIIKLLAELGHLVQILTVAR